MQGRELQEGALRTVSSIYWLLDPATSIDPGLGSPPNSIRDAQQLIGGLDNRLAGSTGDKREGVARALTSAATELDRQIQEVTARRNEAAQADSQPPEVAPPPAQPQETGTPWHATALKYGKMPFSLAGKAWDGFTDGFHRGWKGAVIGTFFMPVIGTSVGWYIDQKWVSGKQR